ncbi:methyl-accepting chemotaxis protein [Herbaspirillum sp. SJZ107]|uniref:methyl-accepting chemotaxis protein n=1 Tax=Herbaspirillum sp. SJZ107 TaxID=2572881 RepID=UPI0011504283|nr:methyl-accepting chemotaxis protein [Herbaspirillum sp. SJZ107]TQK06790.1 methyl-accepting chemotaxis sensory transducer with Cache sensor [Herbaspirillum sp. SJZ107]
MFLSRLNISQKLGLLTLITGIGILAVAAVFLLSERRLIEEERGRTVRQAVEVASGVVTRYQQLAASGAMPEAQAKREALDALRGLRYDGQEYFWVNDMQPRMLMHPISPKLQGQDLSAKADPNGLHLFVAMVDLVRAQGGGFLSYMWPKPGNEAPVPKLSYVKGVPEWGWVLGSGVYMDALDAVFWPRVWMFSGAALLLSGVLMLVGHLISRSIRGPLSSAVRLAGQVAAGDLTTAIEAHGDDETARLLRALRDMNDSLSGIVGEVDNGIRTIASASSQIASGNQDLSSRTEEQAGSLEETAATLEQLTGAVQQNAGNARHASGLASEAAAVAQRGGTVVEQVVSTMDAIDASARRIADIIGVIDGIAFQTNILALNAAVEAARAGEQGRGFAVVASEVRSLAQRSATAAKEVRTLIDDSVAKVGAGAKLVTEAGGTMREIVASVTRVNDIIGEIANAGEQQQAGIAQVNQAIAEMDNATQQNAALVEEAAAAAASMNEQARHLGEVFSVFKVHGAEVQGKRPRTLLPA